MRSSRLWLLAAALLLLLVLGFALVGCSAADDRSTAKEGSSEAAADEDDKGTAKQGSWPMYGGTNQRNMANTTDKDIPESWNVGEGKKDWKNIKWAIDLGTDAYGGPVIAGGRIYVGTNNGRPRDPKIKDDKGVLMCFNESDGKFLWQIVHDKLDNPNDYDNPSTGIVSAPVVEGDRLYYVSNRCEVVCASTEGKVIWTLDMRKELKVVPRAASTCSPLIVGDLLYAVTSNGVTISKNEIESPDAPSFIAVDKKKGTVVWKDNSPGKNIMEGQWSNPVAAEVKGVTQVIFPGGDGWLYSFEAKTGKLLWKFDCNPKDAVFKPGGRGDRGYPVATPVVYDNRLYVGIGMDPQHGPGVGHFWCIDITKEPKNKDKDLSPASKPGGKEGDRPQTIFDPKDPANKDSGLVWHRGGSLVPKPKRGREIAFGRTVSTVAIHDGLVYAPDLDGYVQCLDAKTGQLYWEHDMKSSTWASPYYCDGKVFLGNEGTNMIVFKHGREAKVLSNIDMGSNLQTPVVVANGVLYINTGSQLFAIAPEKK
jgi:outer membrane protein assembly factor BamB